MREWLTVTPSNPRNPIRWGDRPERQSDTSWPGWGSAAPRSKARVRSNRRFAIFLIVFEAIAYAVSSELLNSPQTPHSYKFLMTAAIPAGCSLLIQSDDICSFNDEPPLENIDTLPSFSVSSEWATVAAIPRPAYAPA
jgi:hypothetical protein